MNKFLTVTALASVLALPVAAHAQGGAATGAATGAVGGAVVGGPVGAVVGAGVGAVAGGIADSCTSALSHLCDRTESAVLPFTKEIRVGADLPSSGVTDHDVPKEYGVTKYRYTVVNDRTVLVDPDTYKVIQIIE